MLIRTRLMFPTKQAGPCQLRRGEKKKKKKHICRRRTYRRVRELSALVLNL